MEYSSLSAPGRRSSERPAPREDNQRQHSKQMPASPIRWYLLHSHESVSRNIEARTLSRDRAAANPDLMAPTEDLRQNSRRRPTR